MQFLYQNFLWALLALAIPVILHLFYFRRFKKVYFTNVRFLKEIKEETSARRKLRNFLVLMSRLLALAALVLGFAQPFLPQDVAVKKGEKAISLFVDNSFSMSSLSEDVPLLDKARQRGREIISAYSAEDRFQVLTHDFEGRHQRLVSKEDALTLVDEIKISPAVRELSKVLHRQQQALNSSSANSKAAYVVSDFQRSITDIDNFRDTSLEMNLVPLQSVQEKNISIDSAWFDSPVQMINQTNSLVIKVRNYSDEDAENIRLTLRDEGQVKPVGTLSIPANSSITDTVNITILRTGWHEAELNITDYPIQFDDSYFFSFNVAERIDILVINEDGPNKYLDAAFAGINYFKINNQNNKNLEYAKFANYQLIICNGLRSVTSGLAFELKQYVENGGNVLTFPAWNADISSYKSFLSSFQANELVAFEEEERKVSRVNTEEFVFKDVFENQTANLTLPVTAGNFKLSNFSSRGEERLLTYRDGSVFIGKYQTGKGNLYLCTAPLQKKYNNLVRSGEIFIPMLYKMAISAEKDESIAYIIGRDDVIEADNKIAGQEMVYKLKGKAEEFIPEQKIIGPKVLLGTNNQIREAGYYNLFLEEGNILGKYAFNYDRRESKLDYFNQSDLESLAGGAFNVINGTAVADLTPFIGERSRGVVLWRWCLIAALIFLLIEVLLLRLWKV